MSIVAIDSSSRNRLICVLVADAGPVPHKGKCLICLYHVVQKIRWARPNLRFESCHRGRERYFDGRISIHSFWCIKAETRAVASVLNAEADSRWNTSLTGRVSANFLVFYQDENRNIPSTYALLKLQINLYYPQVNKIDTALSLIRTLHSNAGPTCPWRGVTP